VSSFVVDASVVIKWLVQEVDSTAALALRGHALAAPDLLIPECANILWKKVRRAELTASEANTSARLLERVDIELVPMRRLLAAALRLAIELDHAAYDCTYLALAELRRIPFVTADLTLLRKLRAHKPRPGAEAIGLLDFAQ
jgi:predicted nucleic acid-binding protein